MYQVEMAFGHNRGTSLLPADVVAAAELKTLAVFAKSFGGGQSYHRTGSYLSSDGSLVIEPCTVTLAYAEQIDSNLDNVRSLAADLAAELGQESVLVSVTEVNGQLHWITQRAQ